MIQNSLYAKACTEVLEIISHFSEEDYAKIPKDKIEFFENNKDLNYDYTIDPEKDIKEQYISDEANAIIIGLYREYFATEHQRDVLDDILNNNQVIEDREKSVKYNPDKIFERESVKEDNKNDTKIIVENELIEKKESFFTKLKRIIINFFHIKE